jgi:hypothetical protein
MAFPERGLRLCVNSRIALTIAIPELAQRCGTQKANICAFVGYYLAFERNMPARTRNVIAKQPRRRGRPTLPSWNRTPDELLEVAGRHSYT